MITSRQNQRIKDAAKLRQRKVRQQTQRTLVDGVREISRALLANVEIVEAFVCSQRLPGAETNQLIQQIEEQGALISQVTPEVFEKVAFGDRAEGIVAVVSTPQPLLADLTTTHQGIIAILEGIEKPGNLGAILRSADSAGVAALIVADGRTDLYNPATIRASLGTIFSVPCAATTGREAHDWLRGQNIPILAARPDGATQYTEFNLASGAAFVLGSEAEGLSDVWQGEDIQPVQLPMLGVADSLNVSATAAVLFYEALRQRTAAPK